jgi:hypothetical protein
MTFWEAFEIITEKYTPQEITSQVVYNDYLDSLGMPRRTVKVMTEEEFEEICRDLWSGSLMKLLGNLSESL